MTLLVSLEDMLRQFHSKFPPAAPDAPSLDNLTDALIKFRRGLVDDEITEFHAAVEARDLAAIAKEACDVLYAVAGTATAAGLPLDLVLMLVHASNMSKTPNGTGKAIKGDSYVPAEPLVAALVAYAARYPFVQARMTTDSDERDLRMLHLIRSVLGLDANPAKVSALVTLFGTETIALQQRITGLESSLGEYENALTWNTTCTTCARLLDSCYAESCRAEQAEQTLAALAANPADEEAFGRLVRQVWVAVVREFNTNPKGSWVAGYDEIDPFQQTADKRIGVTLAAAGRAPVQAKLTAIREAAETLAAMDGDHGDYARGQRDAALQLLALTSDDYTRPSAPAVRAYLTATGWTEQPPGHAGSLWTRDDTQVAVWCDGAPDLEHHLTYAIERIARAEARSIADVIRDINQTASAQAGS